jgi:hypothetical protein
MILSGFKFLEFFPRPAANLVKIGVSQRLGRTADAGEKFPVQIGNVQGGLLLGFSNARKPARTTSLELP